MNHTPVTRPHQAHYYAQTEVADLLSALTPEALGNGVVVYTSGSTGTQRAVHVSAAALTASGQSTARFLGGHGQWLLALPTNHIAGIQVLARSVLAGTNAVEMDLTLGFTAESFLAACANMTAPATFTSLVPTQLHRLLDPNSPLFDQVTATLGRFSAILLGGAAAPPALLAQASELGINLVTTYGMSETAGGCVYNGLPLDITRVRTEDPSRPSRIYLAGPMLASGYLTDGGLALPESDFETDHAGTLWHRTNDLGTIDSQGHLTVLGRADDIIISGGVNIAPTQVEALLTARFGITQACVVGIPDPEWGQKVVAVVLSDCAESEIGPLSKIRQFVGDNLSRSARPTQIFKVDGFPLTASGKVDRQQVTGLAQSLARR